MDSVEVYCSKCDDNSNIVSNNSELNSSKKPNLPNIKNVDGPIKNVDEPIDNVPGYESDDAYWPNN